tara:strand:- start:831 stop:1121 length:291 start_codon:yes stop_codon:yes gene_type:complete
MNMENYCWKKVFSCDYEGRDDNFYQEKNGGYDLEKAAIDCVHDEAIRSDRWDPLIDECKGFAINSTGDAIFYRVCGDTDEEPGQGFKYFRLVPGLE